MENQRHWIGYDTIKLIVALILLILLIWLLLQGNAPAQAPVVVADTQTSAPQVNPTVQPSATAIPQKPGPTPTIELIATSLPAPTPTIEPTAISLPTPTPTIEPTSAGLPTPTPTIEPTVVQTPAQAAVDCPLAIPTRLKVGDTARVLVYLHMRSIQGIGKNLVLTNPPGTQLAVIGGPVCVPYQGSAFLWWQVRRPDGKTGWSAEGSLDRKTYFLEPVP